MKQTLYKTAVTTKELPGIAAGEHVAIVKFHENNGTYTIRSISGVLQCMVDASNLERFCL
jgi:hypothetical protein